MVNRLLYPMLAMVVLTLGVLVALFRARYRAVVHGETKASYFKVYRGGPEPERCQQLSRHFTNLFESPTLFYLTCIAAIATNNSSVALPWMAWSFVVLRVAHASIHLGHNRLRPRIAAYFSSWVALLAMWVTVAASP